MVPGAEAGTKDLLEYLTGSWTQPAGSLQISGLLGGGRIQGCQAQVTLPSQVRILGTQTKVRKPGLQPTLPRPHSLCLHFTPLPPSRAALTWLPPGMQSIPPGPPGPVAGWQPFSGFSGDPRAAGGYGAGCATIILEKHPGPLRGPGRALGWVRETLTTWLAVLLGLHSRAACARGRYLHRPARRVLSPAPGEPLPLWSPANWKPVLEAPPHGTPSTGSRLPWSSTPTEPRPHGALPGTRLPIPGAPQDLEARAFLKKLLEQSKMSSLVPTPCLISPTCPTNPCSLLPWVNLVPCPGECSAWGPPGETERAGQEMWGKCPHPQQAAPPPPPQPSFLQPHPPQSYLQHEGATRKRSEQNEPGAQKCTAEEAAEGESQGLESRDQERGERPVLGLELQTCSLGVGGLEQRTSLARWAGAGLVGGAGLQVCLASC